MVCDPVQENRKKLIASKKKGAAPKKAKQAEPDNIMDALRKSISQGKKK